MVSEVLNLSGLDWGFVSCAAVLPRPHLLDASGDSLAADRPILGIMSVRCLPQLAVRLAYHETRQSHHSR